MGTTKERGEFRTLEYWFDADEYLECTLYGQLPNWVKKNRGEELLKHSTYCGVYISLGNKGHNTQYRLQNANKADAELEAMRVLIESFYRKRYISAHVKGEMVKRFAYLGVSLGAWLKSITMQGV